MKCSKVCIYLVPMGKCMFYTEDFVKESVLSASCSSMLISMRCIGMTQG